MLAGLVSQVIARSLIHHNFYEEVLFQDGHQMEHLIPPRDLRSWHGLPVSAIAHFNPIVIEDLSELGLEEILKKHPYRHFPVVQNGKLTGIAPRTEVEASIFEHRPLKLEPALTCLPGQSLRDSQSTLIESTTGMIVLSDKSTEKVLAVVTLHDVLRAQVMMSDREQGI
jgi:CIC family chloride channel protein